MIGRSTQRRLGVGDGGGTRTPDFWGSPPSPRAADSRCQTHSRDVASPRGNAASCRGSATRPVRTPGSRSHRAICERVHSICPHSDVPFSRTRRSDCYGARFGDRRSAGCRYAASVEWRHTKHQVARGSRPDAISGDEAYLIKAVSHLRLTYQIRLLTFLAAENGSRLTIRVPSECRTSADLASFLSDNRRHVRLDRV